MEHREKVCCICNHTVTDWNNQTFEKNLTNWLDENPAFTWNYFNKRVTSSLKDDNIATISTAISSLPNTPSPESPLKNVQNFIESPTSRPNDSSCQEFCSPVSKRILSSSSDGGLTFIPLPSRLSKPVASSKSTRSYTKQQVSVTAPMLDERELINELVFDVCQELDVTSLCFKILQNVCILIGADRGSLFLVDRNPSTNANILVSKLFDVTPECSFDESLAYSDKRHIVIPFGVGISGYVAATGQYANIPDAYSDPRFSDSVDKETGYKTKCILCMPIKNVAGNVLAVTVIMNKRKPATSSSISNQAGGGEEEQAFTDRDVRVFKSYVAFCGIGLHNAQLYQNSRIETYRNQVLLELARVIFTEQTDVTRLIYTILTCTISVLHCQRCQLLLVQEDFTKDGTMNTADVRFSHVYNLTWSNACNFEAFQKKNHSVENSEFPVQLELATAVFQTGETINLTNAYDDRRFNAAVEKDCGPIWCTKALLCVPVKTSDGRVLGVCFLVNKSLQEPCPGKEAPLAPPVASTKMEQQDDVEAEERRLIGVESTSDGLHTTDWSGVFSLTDECLFEAFSLFAGLGIVSRQVYERMVRLVAKQRVTLDVLAYHSTARKSEAVCLAKAMIPTVRFYQLDDFLFNDTKLSDEATLKACVRMFIEIDFLRSSKVDRLAFCQWLLSVKKNYRAVTYHNWRHALNVTQTMFATIKKAGLDAVFNCLECLALMVACLAHDLDHRGTDNQFQVKTMSPLVELYSTSVLEHHHFNQFMIILTRKGNDFLSCLEPCNYKLVIKLVREFILATDLSRFFTHLPQFKRLLAQRSTTTTTTTQTGEGTSMEPWASDPDQRALLACMLMTSSDLAAITKPWPIQKTVADLLTMEFFAQGDLEKDKFNTQPNELMDRTRACDIPTLQVKFIDAICLPVYQNIVQISSALQPLLDGCIRNRACWCHLSEGGEVPESLYGITTDAAGETTSDSCQDSLEAQHIPSLDSWRNRAVATATLQSLTSRRLSLSSASTVGGAELEP